MSDQAKVTSLDALAHFRAGLAKFSETAGLAISNAENDVQRTMWWLQNDQIQHWQRQIKRFEKIVSEAKAELASAELQHRDLRPSLVIERKKIQAAQHRLEEARVRLQRTRHWARAMEREYMLFKAATGSLAGRIEREMPMAHARLGKLIGHLEQYVRMTSGVRKTDDAETPETPEKETEA